MLTCRFVMYLSRSNTCGCPRRSSILLRNSKHSKRRVIGAVRIEETVDEAIGVVVVVVDIAVVVEGEVVVKLRHWIYLQIMEKKKKPFIKDTLGGF